MGAIARLMQELGKLPGIGPKSAQRIAFHLLSVEPPEIDRLQAALQKVRDGVRFCAVCGTVSDGELCRFPERPVPPAQKDLDKRFKSVADRQVEAAVAVEVSRGQREMTVADLETQGSYDVKYLRYWVNEDQGKVFCLVEAPSAKAAETVHREAHGLVADSIFQVQEGS